MNNMTILTESAISTDILALHIYENYLLIGEGSNLLLYNINENHHISTVQLFSAAAVHGIKQWNNFPKEISPKFLIWGQKSFALASLNVQELKWEFVSEEFQTEDWIVDAACSRDELSIILATAHNSLIHYDVSPLLKDFVNSRQENSERKSLNSPSCIIYPEYCIIGKKECNENSLIYCGQITGVSWTACVVLSGTAFGKIHIWAPWTTPNSHGRVPPIASLSGPKGAIFSVTYDEIKKLIAATSDDRSVRVWKVCLSHQEKHSTENMFSEYQSTWLSCYTEQIYCSFGHTARVWRSLILEDKTVLSCGEDSTICHWSEFGSLLSSWVAHPSSSVWCLASKEDFVITGGGDGAVKRWKISGQNQGCLVSLPIPWTEGKKIGEERTTEKRLVFSMKLDSESLRMVRYSETALAKELKKKNFPRSISLVNGYTTAMVSDNGCVWIYKKSEKIWKLVFQHSFLKGYIVSAINNDSSLLVLGTLTGHIMILKVGTWNCICQHLVGPSKIQCLMFVDSNKIITCTGSGQIQLWTLYLEDTNTYLQLTSHHILPPCRHRWITAAAFMSQNSQENFYLAVGDSCGSVYLYILNNKDPKSGLKGLHGRSGVTSVKANGNVLITTGRDGHIRYLVVKDGQIIVIYNLKLSLGTWLCGLLKLGSVLIAPVFNGNKLQLWNVVEEKLIAEVECGGGHRSWDILVGTKRFSCSGTLEEISKEDDDTKLTCAFLRDGAPVVWEFVMSNKLHPTIKSAICGREIQCLEPLFRHGGGVLFSFGGENTLLNIQILQGGKLHKISAIKSHLSSVRSITRIKRIDGKESTSKEVHIVSCGGRAQIKVWRVSLTKRGIDQICKSTSAAEHDQRNTLLDFLNPIVLCKEICSHMLKAESGHQSITYDPETRYMDSLAFWITEDTALFILASSDGFIRFFKYSDETQFILLHDQDCEFCLFRLCLLRLKEHIYLVASTSRGNILLWDLKVVLNLFHTSDSSVLPMKLCDSVFETVQYQVQDSGLNSLAANEGEINESELHFAAGGDDGSIHLLKLSSRNTKQRHLRLSINICTCSKVSLHAAQVSGLVWLSKTRICSVSVDQRLIIWRLEEQNLIPISVHFSSVPDIQGLKLFTSHSSATDEKEANTRDETIQVNMLSKIFIYGTGIQVFDVSEEIK